MSRLDSGDPQSREVKPEGIKVRVLSGGRSSGAPGVSQALCCYGRNSWGP